MDAYDAIALEPCASVVHAAKPLRTLPRFCGAVQNSAVPPWKQIFKNKWTAIASEINFITEN